NGVLLTNHHTPLIAHDATDILTSFTGLYGDRMGVPIGTTFRYFAPSGTTSAGVAFAYWTDPVFDPTTATPTDTKFNLLGADGKNGRPDLLPDEPGGYTGFTGLFGHKYVAPQIGGTGTGGVELADLDGETIQDTSGHIGFPGFAGMAAKVSLAYVADMQEHGI